MNQLELNVFYENFLSSVDSSLGTIQDSIAVSLNDISQKYDQIAETFPCKALGPITKLAKNIQAFATCLFAQLILNPGIGSESLIHLCNITETLLSFPLESALKIKTIMSFIKLKNLKVKLLKHIDKCKAAFTEHNEEEFMAAVLKVIYTVSQIFDAPQTISKFLSLFTIKLPLNINKFFLITSTFSVFLQPSKILSKIKEYKYTLRLLTELKRERNLAFLKSYFHETNNVSKTCKRMQLLSDKKLKKAVRLAKNHLKKANALQTLQKIKHVANIHYAKILNEKIKARPDIIGKVFKVKFENKQTPELTTLAKSEEILFKDGSRDPPLCSTQKAECSKNFFEDLVSKRMQKFSNQVKLNQAVKIINARLKFRMATHVFMAVTKSISWMSSLFGQLETFGLPLNPISPIRILVETSLAAVSLVNFFYQNKKKDEFVKDMEALTSRHFIFLGHQ